MYSMNSFTTSAIPLICESGRDLPKRGTLGGDNFLMSNLGSGCVEGDPLLPFLFNPILAQVFECVARWNWCVQADILIFHRLTRTEGLC